MFEQSTTELFNHGPRIDYLRNAIRANRIHFPEPVPIFPYEYRPDIQWRLVELYFICGWSTRRLAKRYGVTTRRIQQSLQHWAARAVARGYLHEIPAGNVYTMPPVQARFRPDQPTLQMVSKPIIRFTFPAIRVW